jgi:trehalose-phosphatase
MAPATLPIDVGEPGCASASAFWDRICSALAQRTRLFVFAADDTFSGAAQTISPDPGALRALRRLCREPRVSVAILSKRSAAAVSGRFGLPVTYIGLNGLEIKGPDTDFIAPEAHSVRQTLPDLARRLSESVGHIPGTLVECRSTAVSVSYGDGAPGVVSALQKSLASFIGSGAYELEMEEFSMDVHPRLRCAKHEAVSWLLQRRGAGLEESVYIGHGESDEETFQRLHAALNVRVMDEAVVKTTAPYSVRRRAVADLLHGLAEAAEGIR